MKKCIKKQWNEFEKIDFFLNLGMQFESRMEKRLWKVQSRFYPAGDLMTRKGDREIRSVSGRLPDNPGELACMQLSMICSPRNKIEHKYDAMFVFCVTVEFSEVWPGTLSAVQALTNNYFFLCDKPDILSRLTCHFKAERECIYFQETTLKSKDDKQRKISAVFYSPLCGFIIRATNKHGRYFK